VPSHSAFAWLPMQGGRVICVLVLSILLSWVIAVANDRNLTLTYGNDWPNAEMQCIATSAKAVGLDYDYPTMMAGSGHAFRIMVLDYEPWCPSCFGDYGSSPSISLARCIPTLTRLEPRDGADYVNRILAALAGGGTVPALGDWWWGIITAQDEPRSLCWTVVTYEGSVHRVGLPAAAWILFPPPTAYRTAAARAIISQAIDLADRPEWSGPREGSRYANGEAAWQVWIGLLQRNETEFAALAPAHTGDGGIAECYRRNFWWLAYARAAAADYCTDLAGRAPPAARPHLQAAGEAYRGVHETMAAGRASLPNGLEAWPAEMRAIQAKVMSAASQDEARAVEALRAALAAWPEAASVGPGP